MVKISRGHTFCLENSSILDSAGSIESLNVHELPQECVNSMFWISYLGHL